MQSGLRGQSVLVVEDGYYQARDTARSLVEAGAEVLGPFSTEAAALECLSQASPSLASVDINLGEGQSYGVPRALRERAIPFVFVTGYDRSAISAEYEDVERLEKPVRQNEIVAALVAITAIPAAP